MARERGKKMSRTIYFYWVTFHLEAGFIYEKIFTLKCLNKANNYKEEVFK